MKTYLTQTKFSTYKYQRRVPKPLIEYTNSSSYFRVSLGADITEATATAIHYNSLIDEALQLVKLHIADDIIISKLGVLLPTKKIVSNKDGFFTDVVYSYLCSKEATVSSLDYSSSKYFYNEVCPYVFKHIGLTANPRLKDVTYNQLLKFKDTLIQLPKRNIQKYKSMDLVDILKILDDIPSMNLISANTINKYIQRLRALFSFSQRLGFIDNNIATSIKLLEIDDDKLQRLPLTVNEVHTLLDLVSSTEMCHKRS